MATLKQIEANRLNAKKSTGPRTSEGKAASRLDALKSGIDAASTIVRGEDPQALQALTAEYHDRYQPATPEQRALVDSLIHHEWLLRRLRKTEAQMWEREFQALGDYLADDIQLAQAFYRNTDLFNRLQRRIDSTERNYHRALKDLERLRPQPSTQVSSHDPSSPAPGPRPPAPASSPQPSPPKIGFVPSPASTLLPQRVLGVLRASAVNPAVRPTAFVPQVP